jgi:hypothetical protein
MGGTPQDRSFRQTGAGSRRRTGARSFFAAAAVAALAAGCGSSNGPCRVPPPEELSKPSALALTLSPNPVESGSEATLSLDRVGLGDSAITGAGAAWECWDGDGWVDTHQVVKGFGGSGPRTIEVEPGVTTTIPAVGLPIPSRHSVLVPEVPAGMYRIADSAIDGGSVIKGFVIVEVLDAP